MRMTGWMVGAVLAAAISACTPPPTPGPSHQRLVSECRLERASVRTAVEAVRVAGDPTATPELYVDTSGHRFVGWTGTPPVFELTWLDGDLSLGVTPAECGFTSA